MDNILTIQNKLKTINKQLYIVGGFCRDRLLGWKNQWDIDLSTNATPKEIKTVLRVVWEVWKKYGTCIVSELWESYELTSFRKDIWSINNRKPAEVVFTDSLESDAKRRDFTCNSIYYNPGTQQYIDPENGIVDIQNKTLRFIWKIEDRLNEDALRILRCIRFKNKYNFNYAQADYQNILKRHIHLLKNLPIERIKQEFDLILIWKNNTQALEDLKQIWFLKLYFPELDCLNLCLWNKHHLEWDVWTHTKMCIDEMNIIIKREHINSSAEQLILLWAILLHDIWKGPTHTIWDDWEWHYYDHENIWATIFQENLSKRLKFSRDSEKKIFFLIKEHLRVFLIPNMKTLKSRKLMMQPYFPELLLLAEADNKWRRPQKLDTYNHILDIYNNFQEILPKKVFLTGQDIMSRYPQLQWREIWERLQQLNDQILIHDKINNNS